MFELIVTTYCKAIYFKALSNRYAREQNISQYDRYRRNYTQLEEMIKQHFDYEDFYNILALYEAYMDSFRKIANTDVTMAFPTERDFTKLVRLMIEGYLYYNNKEFANG